MEKPRIWVGYDIASKLKEVGFAEVCIYHYKKDEDGERHTTMPTFEVKNHFGLNYNSVSTRVSAPLWQQVFDWIDDNHGYFLSPCHRMNGDNKVYCYTIHRFDRKHSVSYLDVDWTEIGTFTTNREAQEATVNKVLELIEKQ